MLETNCHTIKDLKKIHAHLIKTGLAKDTVAASRVLAFCATGPARDLDYAFSVFKQIEEPNLFIWNTIIRGFCQSSDPRVAISLFVEMLVGSRVRPEKLTYPAVFKAYTQLGLAEDGAQLHGTEIFDSNKLHEFLEVMDQRYDFNVLPILNHVSNVCSSDISTAIV
ncbi:Pentatricopeptide repeat-containing protein, chloroplastic [Sesamum alatum]|uniref:Pentatricopeptide repeat-containing protein, chloroplastic n=1 Tax=Sesamum alatum TaxID=300844 RepID=A0AAE1YZ59_9LAMI|nr:Pentatricopeptide repeat-containing protein, chloroplastic [Sesamum alatum]